MNAARATLEKRLEVLRERRRDATERVRTHQEAADAAKILAAEARDAIAQIEAVLLTIPPEA